MSNAKKIIIVVVIAAVVLTIGFYFLTNWKDVLNGWLSFGFKEVGFKNAFQLS